jgi:hypothetical protein
MRVPDELSEAELDQIIALCDAVTLGLWESFIEGCDHLAGSSFILTRRWQGTKRGGNIELFGASWADQECTAQARQDIPRLHARCLASAPSRLEIGVADFVVCWEASDYTEVSHEQEVHCSSVG